VAPETGEPDRRLEEAEQLAAERLDQLMRMKADFENYRKRVIREQTEIVDRASRRVVERLLEVLDDFDRALDAARSHEGAEGIVRGMELVYNRLVDILLATLAEPTGVSANESNSRLCRDPLEDSRKAILTFVNRQAGMRIQSVDQCLWF
jgi:molecular chaperone GrpE (heat shock protein)